MDSLLGKVPIVDLEAANDGDGSHKNALCRALGEVGFAYIKNHGIPETKIREAFEWSRKFFDLPESEKQKAPHPPEGWYHRGYSPVGREKVTQMIFDSDNLTEQRKIPDQKESFDLGKEDDDLMANIWPPEGTLPGFREFFADFYNICNSVEDKILNDIAVGLGLPANYFQQLHRSRDNQLRLLHYPPFDAALLSSGQADCIGAHSDFGTLTLLFQDDVGGLEIEDPNNSGKFIPVPNVAGTIVVNIGDILMRWTNDELKSTIHRVRTPSDTEISAETGLRMTKRRYSMPFFICADVSTLVDCVPTCHGPDRPKKYEPVTVDDYVTMRMNALY